MVCEQNCLLRTAVYGRTRGGGTHSVLEREPRSPRPPHVATRRRSVVAALLEWVVRLLPLLQRRWHHISESGSQFAHCASLWMDIPADGRRGVSRHGRPNLQFRRERGLALWRQAIFSKLSLER